MVLHYRLARHTTIKNLFFIFTKLTDRGFCFIVLLLCLGGGGSEGEGRVLL